MKNFKKVISLVLALAMVLSLATTAFGAATTSDEKAEVLYDLGLFQGTSTSEYVPNLTGAADREQAMVMLARAFAWDLDEDATTDFPDDSPAWGEASVAKAVELLITNGVGDGTTFGARNSISAREMKTWIDRALGTPIEGSWEANADVDSTTPLDRGDLVDMIWDALMETPIDGTETLIETIVGTNSDLVAIAAAGGLMEVAVDTAQLFYDDELMDGTQEMKADGAASTLIKFQLTDSVTGEPAVLDYDFEVQFSTTFGTLAEQRVTSEGAVATVLLTSEFLTEDVTVSVTAEIIESEREQDENIGRTVVANFIMTPDPGSVDLNEFGASVTAAEANEADRVILYFNRDVEVADYVNATTGAVDGTKAAIVIRKDSTTLAGGTAVAVAGLMPLVDFDGEVVPNALQVILDVETNPANALTDNSDVYVSFTDSTKNLDVPSVITFKFTDTRRPSLLSVDTVGLTQIVLEFSEAVIDEAVAGDEIANAELLTNWQVDGHLLTEDTWGDTVAATVQVGSFSAANGTDNRHVVTITIGRDLLGNQIYLQAGTHSIQAANIGDWARLTDDKNKMNTQTLDFVIDPNTDVPNPTVDVQSPEQYVLTFNCLIDLNATGLANVLKVQKYNNTTSTWADFAANSVTAAVADANVDFIVSDITPAGATGSVFMIETDYDWTREYNTAVNHTNYWNDRYQLAIAANTIKNVANGLKNAAIALPLTDEMYSPDVASPTIDSIEEEVNATTGAKTGNYIATMSEPVKVNNGALQGVDPITDSQDQAGAIPTPLYEFIKIDNSVTIPGDQIALNNDDTKITIDPRTALTPGDWTLVIRSISDDVGNTSASVTKVFTVAGTAPTATSFEILWAFADIDHEMEVTLAPNTDDVDGPVDVTAVTSFGANEDDAYDFVFIKFSEPLATSGDYKNALKTTNYTIDGHTLPDGSQIVANIENYDDWDGVIDSVTIALPNGTLETVDRPHNINVSPYIENTDGDKLGTSGGEKTLPYVNVAAWAASPANYTADLATLQAQIAADLAAIDYYDAATGNEGAADAGMDDIEAAYRAAIVDPSQANLDEFEEVYANTYPVVDALSNSLVEAQLKAYMDAKYDELQAAIIAGNLFLVTAGADANEAFIEFGNDSVDIFEPTEDDYTAGGSIADIALDPVTTVNGTPFTFTHDAGATSQTISIVDDFWGVQSTMSVTTTADNTWTLVSNGTTTAADATGVSVHVEVMARPVEAAYDAIVDPAVPTGAELNTFEAAYEPFKPYFDAMVASDYTTEITARAYTGGFLDLQDEIVSDNLFLVAAGGANEIEVNFGAGAALDVFDITSASEYTFTCTTVDGATATIGAATGTGTGLVGTSGDTAGDDVVTATIVDVFWGVQTTSTLTVTHGTGATVVTAPAAATTLVP